MSAPAFFARSEFTTALWSFRREFVMVGIFSMVANVLMLSPTLYMLQVYDRVMLSRSELTLLAVSLITLFFFAAMAFAEWSRSRVLVRAGVRLDKMLSTRIFNAAFEANLSQSGAPAERAFSDLTEIRQFLTGNGIFAFFDAPWTPIYLAVVFFLHPILGWVSVGFALAQAALAWFGHQRAIEPTEKLINVQSDVNLYLQRKLHNVEVVESMGMLAGLRQRWRQRYGVYRTQHGLSHSHTLRIMSWSKWVRYSQQSLMLAVGALLVIDRQMSPGGMIAANVLMGRALAPIDMIVGTWRSFIGASTAFFRLEKLLLAHPERDPALTRTPPTGAITLREVVAKASGRDKPILNGVSLQAEAGSVTVIMGPSGSGKSTLARVLVGIWPGVQGEVLLNGLPLSGWNRAELGPHLGYLPQDIELFDGSIAENIARFTELDSNKVIAATKVAGLHESILRFPKGYDTPIGEAGNLLSGGQRQRIGLARAIYGSPKLVVLDEPNANLDESGEAALVVAVQQLKAKGVTVFLITHRPSAISLADQLLLLRGGQVQIQGPRDQVLAAMRAASGASA